MFSTDQLLGEQILKLFRNKQHTYVFGNTHFPHPSPDLVICYPKSSFRYEIIPNAVSHVANTLTIIDIDSKDLISTCDRAPNVAFRHRLKD